MGGGASWASAQGARSVAGVPARKRALPEVQVPGMGGAGPMLSPRAQRGCWPRRTTHGRSAQRNALSVSEGMRGHQARMETHQPP